MTFKLARPKEQADDTDGLMCSAMGCPNRWAVNFGTKLCSAHAKVEDDPRQWPAVTEEQRYNKEIRDGLRARGIKPEPEIRPCYLTARPKDDPRTPAMVARDNLLAIQQQRPLTQAQREFLEIVQRKIGAESGQ